MTDDAKLFLDTTRDEIARNVISERVLGFPREYAADRGVPFNQVRHNTRS